MKKIINFSNLNIESLFEKIKNTRKVFWFLGVHIFAFILIFIFLDILFGTFLLYEYAILAQQREPEAVVNTLKFNSEAYAEVLGKLQARDLEFSAVPEKKYPSPF